MPAFNWVGRREHWLQFDPRSLRSWAMTPLAFTVGLMSLEASERSRVPVRRHVLEVEVVSGQLPPKHVYVGQGHHSTRTKRTKWSAPFTPGHDCRPDEYFYVQIYPQPHCTGSCYPWRRSPGTTPLLNTTVTVHVGGGSNSEVTRDRSLPVIETCLGFLPRYLHFVSEQLLDDLGELTGQVLVYDTSPELPSAADVLAGLIFEMLAPDPQLRTPLRRGAAAKPPRSGRAGVIPKTIGLAVAPLAHAAHVFTGHLSQETLALAVRKLFPES